jgi:hypothetical protein
VREIGTGVDRANHVATEQPYSITSSARASGVFGYLQRSLWSERTLPLVAEQEASVCPTETGLRGWALFPHPDMAHMGGRTRTQKCRRKLSL